MKKLLILMVLTAICAFSANAQTLKTFAGKYELFEDGGKTAGGTAIYVGHSLKINADGGVTLTADGYQTARDLICTAKIEGGKLNIYFTLYNADGTNSLTDYNADDLMLTLEYKQVKGKKVLWTTFGKYTPVVNSAKKGGGVYFKKSKG